MSTTVSPLKILSDLGINPWEIENDEDYLRALKEGIITIESSTKGKGDRRSEILREELIRVRKERKAAPSTAQVGVKEKKTTIKAAKLLPGTSTTKPDDLKQAQIDQSGDDKSKLLQPDILNDIAKSVESIATLLKRQLGVEKKQQRDAKIKQDKDNKAAREDKLEGKPKDKKTGLIPKSIAKPAIGFFGKIKDFIFNIGIGTALYKMHDWLTDPENEDKIGKFTDFLSEHAPKILGGLAALAVLPVLGGIIGTIGGIMGGLSMLGLAVPLLPVILKVMLVAAVAALAIAAVNWFAKKIVGGAGFQKARHQNLQRLESQGMTKSGVVKDDQGMSVWAPIFGENSLTGREWREEDTLWAGRNDKARVNLVKGTISKEWGTTTISPKQHQDWYAKNFGQEALDAKLAARNQYETTLADIKSKEAEMRARIKEETLTTKQQDAIASESSGLKVGPLGGLRNPNNYRGDEFNERVKLHRQIAANLKLKNIAIENRIRAEYNKDVLKIFEASQLEQFNIDTSSDINNDQAFLKNNDRDQLISFVAPGTGGDQNQAITEGVSGSGGTPTFGGRVLGTFTTADLYNLQTT